MRNRNYEGPGFYTQTLSVTGLPAGTAALVFSIQVNTGTQTAWGFFQGGCPGPLGFAAQAFVADCDTIPGLRILANYLRGADSPTDDLLLQFRADPAFVPDPQKCYGLATLVFDHRRAESDCCCVTEPLCFRFDGGFCRVGDTFVFAAPESDRLTWNDPSAAPDCAPRRQGLAAFPSSWGRLKSRYR
jgi:hypothetical protein